MTEREIPNQEDQGLIQQFFSGTGTSLATGTAKASPGIAVSGFHIFGMEIDLVVSLLTLGYMILLIIGAIPKVMESCRYIVALFKHRKTAADNIVVIRNDVTAETVGRKIQNANSETNDGGVS